MQADNNGKCVSGYSGPHLINAKLKEFEGSTAPMEYLVEFFEESFNMHNQEDRENLFVPGKVILLYEMMDLLAEDVDEEEEDKLQMHACVLEGTHKVLVCVNNRLLKPVVLRPTLFCSFLLVSQDDQTQIGLSLCPLFILILRESFGGHKCGS
jgi:hypothetical protein